MSHLLQMRGLKLNPPYSQPELKLSHLLQMRGLKPARMETPGAGGRVASFTDAWIETCDYVC